MTHFTTQWLKDHGYDENGNKINPGIVKQINSKKKVSNITSEDIIDYVQDEILKKNRIFIKGNVPSQKNSKQWTGKLLISSKLTRKYKSDTKTLYEYYRSKFHALIASKEKPYHIGMTFIRDSRRRFDFINAAQCPLDMMVKHGWIEDDNADIVIPVFKQYIYNKDNPGLIIEVL